MKRTLIGVIPVVRQIYVVISGANELGITEELLHLTRCKPLKKSFRVCTPPAGHGFRQIYVLLRYKDEFCVTYDCKETGYSNLLCEKDIPVVKGDYDILAPGFFIFNDCKKKEIEP